MERFTVLNGSWAIARLDPGEPAPKWAAGPAPFVSITRTRDELSIVAPDAAVPAGVRCERGWAAIRLLGPFSFDQVGVLASFTAPLAEAGVSLFAISTFDTDYVLVKSERIDAACAALAAAGHELVAGPVGDERSE